MKRELIQFVKDRAQACCEYCLVPEGYSLPSYQLDHIYAEKHGGLTSEENLCYSCARCNRYKGPNLAGLDPDRVQDEPTNLFHPRRDKWSDHFYLQNELILGKTTKGRATVHVLNLNHDLNRMLRQHLIENGLYPPPHLQL